MQDKAKYKHNKKRNTGFLYSVLIQELTKSILNKDKNKEKIIKQIIKECFSKKCEMKKELDIYKQFENLENLSKNQIQDLLNLSKIEYMKINESILEKEKDRIIREINYKIGTEIYSNFIPNFRLLATLDQIFNNKLSLKNKMMLEHKFIEEIEQDRENITKLPSIDNLTFRTFVEKFNNKYSSLLEEQKNLLYNYILSLEQNNVGFKFYVNEEIFRMKNVITESSSDNKEIKDKLLQKLDEYKTTEISQEMLVNMLKIQELVNSLCRSK